MTEYHWHRAHPKAFVAKLFINTDPGPGITITVCGRKLAEERVTASEPTRADMTSNPDLWCPKCFGDRY